MSTTRRACLLARGAFVAAVLGGALVVPTAAFAHAQPDRAAAPAAASSPEHGTPDSNPLFLAVGGGMAAAGAGGLAFSMYRRGRTDG
ncbi:hypothetical protein ABZS88_23510 [Streptomyces sp. NPDC005480]|uniref:hypothetical protein n=1 Tax=Streptomyces sp. NPDC005480 TaxID=3154880 RepID=UPI00339E0AD1